MSYNRENRYLIFSDESGTNGTEQYQAIGTISGSRQEMIGLHKELGYLLQQYDCSEVKFTKIKGDSNYIKIAKYFVNLGLKKCFERTIRISVMVWDMYDSRHSVQGRDDIENLKRMYFKALKVTISHWDSQFEWEFYPDEHTAIKWSEIAFYLRRKNFSKTDKDILLLSNEFRELNFARVHPPKQASSSKFYIIQLADLFTGIVRASHQHGQELMDWGNAKCNLLFDAYQRPNVSKNLSSKLEIMSHFKDQAKKYNLGVNLSEDKYFKTFNRSKNIFLWKYEPQHKNDKAPVKIKEYMPGRKCIVDKSLGSTRSDTAIIDNSVKK